MSTDSFRINVCCGIVLYNPEIEVLEKNISVMLPQVDSIVLVDNNSTNFDEITSLCRMFNSKIVIIRNLSNKGIARALNQILEYADHNSYEWFITMDQDSEADRELVSKYKIEIEKKSHLDVAAYAPFVLNNGKISMGEYQKHFKRESRCISDPIECITSGMMVRVSAAQIIRGYDEQLFIDCVDIDFNIRLMLENFRIVQVTNTFLLQTMGKGKKIVFFERLYKVTHFPLFRSLAVSPVYSDQRIYYICRNSRFIRKKYGNLSGKRMALGSIILQMLYYTFTFPLKHSRLKMIRAMGRGFRDAKLLEVNR